MISGLWKNLLFTVFFVSKKLMTKKPLFYPNFSLWNPPYHPFNNRIPCSTPENSIQLILSPGIPHNHTFLEKCNTFNLNSSDKISVVPFIHLLIFPFKMPATTQNRVLMLKFSICHVSHFHNFLLLNPGGNAFLQ